MAKDEISAEKILAVLVRSEPRDVFDLYFLLTKLRVTPDVELINRKLGLYKKTFSKKELVRAISVFEASFSQQMRRLADPRLTPSIGDVVKTVKKAFPD